MLHRQIRQTLFLSIHVQSINKSCQLSFQRSRQWHPTPVLLPGKFHGWRSLVGCSPWGREESDTTEWLHFHFSLSCIGEGNGTPLQYSCLENPMDGGAWWAAIYGVTRSQTQLKWLSSSSSSNFQISLNLTKLHYLHCFYHGPNNHHLSPGLFLLLPLPSCCLLSVERKSS